MLPVEPEPAEPVEPEPLVPVEVPEPDVAEPDVPVPDMVPDPAVPVPDMVPDPVVPEPDMVPEPDVPPVSDEPIVSESVEVHPPDDRFELGLLEPVLPLVWRLLLARLVLVDRVDGRLADWADVPLVRLAELPAVPLVEPLVDPPDVCAASAAGSSSAAAARGRTIRIGILLYGTEGKACGSSTFRSFR